MNQALLTRGLRRLSGFAVSTALTGVIGVLVIPVIVTTAGATAWSAVAVGTACGSVGAVLCGFGWAVTGPATVAVLGAEERIAHIAESFAARALLAVIAIPSAAITAALLTPAPFTLPAALVATSTALGGLGAGWYFVGTAAPGRLLLAETLPRSAANVIGAVLMIHGFGLPSFAVAQLAAAVLTVLLGQVLAERSAAPRRRRAGLPRVETYRAQLPGFLTGAVASVYQAMPTLVVAAVAPAAVAPYALAERLLKLADTAQTPFSQTLQSWVPTAGPASLRHRARRATGIAGVVGVCLGLGLLLLAPSLAGAIGAGAIAIPLEVAVPLGIALAMTVVSQCAGIACLVPLGRSGAVALSALAGAGTAAALLGLLAPTLGAAGAMWSVAAAEIVVTGLECAILLRLTRTRPARTSRSPGK